MIWGLLADSWHDPAGQGLGTRLLPRPRPAFCLLWQEILAQVPLIWFSILWLFNYKKVGNYRIKVYTFKLFLDSGSFAYLNQVPDMCLPATQQTCLAALKKGTCFEGFFSCDILNHRDTNPWGTDSCLLPWHKPEVVTVYLYEAGSDKSFFLDSLSGDWVCC